METIFRRVKSKCNELEIMANVFPFSQLGFRTKYRTNRGTLMSALRKSTTARLAKRMFGKLRRFLKRLKMAMNDPLPIVETNVNIALRNDITT